MTIVTPLTARIAACDWHQCNHVATWSVRVDVPRGDSFTSLMWTRCGDHNPERAS